MSDVKPSLYRVKDLAARWSISEWEVRRLVKAGELERRYVGTSGRTYRITAASVEAYEASLSSEPA